MRGERNQAGIRVKASQETRLPAGQFVIAPTPIGVVVAETSSWSGRSERQWRVAYQFNGIYYQPVFVNGVTQFQTFAPDSLRV